MKRNLIRLSSILAIIFVITLFVGCDLSHKHYCDYKGVCRQCQQDTSHLLTKDIDGVYKLSGNKTVFTKTNMPEAYFKFVSNGEASVEINIVTEGNAEIDKVYFYRNNANTYTGTSDSSGKIYTYSNINLQSGETYYIKVITKSGGNVGITLKDV